MNPDDYGWSGDEQVKTLTPITVSAEVALAPAEVLEVVRCNCSTVHPCSSTRCGCVKARLSCTPFCLCKGELLCFNEHTKPSCSDNEETDDQESDIEN